MIRISLRIGQPAGIHARIAAQAVLLASRYSSSVFVRTSGGTASLTRLADLLGLDIDYGQTVELLADGPDEAAALEEIGSFLRSGSHDERTLGHE
ncbi:HPr family phosphocarrier protein [Acidipropionibacterium virtanenii]|uniref:HPr-like protein Crh n=1 Tax=Acidipropionibacterium virtanenii TaxID=2057246 RepID=A0A344UT89_9ACTN|nr:HPr family phosphocarrier protein [Acidipropionibacterium virtanenii]AXE38487.1 HPr-like protein Crh [Acidipropionibacterium virtanenii]